MDRKTKLVQRLLCGTLCFLKLRHQPLDSSGFVNKNTGHFPSHSIIINNRRAIIPCCFRRIGAQQLHPETTSTHSGNQEKRKHSPAPQHSTKNGHFRQLGLVHRYIQCSFCGFAQKLPRTTAHPLANKIYKQHTHTSTLYHQQQPPLPNIQANARKAKCQTVVRLCCCLNFVNGCSCSRAYPASGAWDIAPQAKNKQRTTRESIVSAYSQQQKPCNHNLRSAAKAERNVSEACVSY